MSKTLRTGLTVIVISVIFIVAFAVLLTFLSKSIRPQSEFFVDASQYVELLGQNGSYKQSFVGNGDIFPEIIADTADVEGFRVEFKQPYEGKSNYMAYLVYKCDGNTFESECERLRGIASTGEEEYKGIYGITEFKKTLLAIYADEKYGVTYALCDEADRTLVYFALKFDEYYTDIDYAGTVDAEYLPTGFNAYMGNAIFEDQRKQK